VDVLDSGPTPASGASGLPAGLVVPHVSPDDNLLARTTRLGAQRTWLEVTRLLRDGQDYAVTGVREQLFDRATQLPSGHRWHAQAGWIKPFRLVQALLEEPGVRYHASLDVRRLQWRQGLWQALDAKGNCLASAPHLVVCAGFASHDLLDRFFPLQALRGQLSWALHRADEPPGAFPDTPVNGAGNFAARVPTPQGAAWYLGSTFDRDDTDTTPRRADHEKNWRHLQQMLPDTAQALASQFAHDDVQHFTAIRCAARDRMPVVGAVPTANHPGLWVSTAMGSRGLSLAVLCAELLVAQMQGQPCPIEAALARNLSTARKALRKQLR
jgi:tRNA 5-methylaminomethyl-2-thiouridine biosynthesis bifunctional protein